MFGHLRPEQFITVVEGGTIAPDQRKHLDSCPRCRDTWQSVESAYLGMKKVDDDIVEPDWSEFRSSVRNEMLSRSVRRQAAAPAWSLKPALAWGFSVILAVGITAGLFVSRERAAQVPVVPTVEFIEATVQTEPLIETQGVETEIEVWSVGNVFEELSTLESEEVENLRRLLEAEPDWMVQTQ
jgi:hypothetical protein